MVIKEGPIVELVKFKALEEKINHVLSRYELLKTRNQELEEQLKKTISELEGARNRLKELNEEREGIHARVDSLLTLLQDVKV
jgi:hypothetical protein